MIDLTNTTLIIPIKIEHPDRYRNAKTVLGYINKHIKTTVFIYEISDGESKLDFLKELENLEINHWLEQPEEAFHRTKYLNIMLDEVVTPVVANYDIDIILTPDNYRECQESIIKGECEVIYPYEFSGSGQRAVNMEFDHSNFINLGFDIEMIDRNGPWFEHPAEYGHCIFFNTEAYKKFGAENENFISYGPEDKERGFRFSRLGLNVQWKPGYKVYHFEHYRGNDSSALNPHIRKNWEVYENLYRFTNENLLKYYLEVEYIKKYKTIGNE
jgi:predicted glycosyltransferase involved in capsule biosynthesis